MRMLDLYPKSSILHNHILGIIMPFLTPDNEVKLVDKVILNGYSYSLKNSFYLFSSKLSSTTLSFATKEKIEIENATLHRSQLFA